MKLYRFLIIFFTVNVSTYDIMDYIKEVFITNAHIKLAHNMNNFTIKEKFVLNGLEHVIKKIVERGLHNLASMNNMIAGPEFQLFNKWDELIETQVALREVIQSELNIPVPQVPDENIPVPELEIFGRITLVDLGEKRREFTGLALKNILSRITNFGEPENATELIQQRRLRGSEVLETRMSRALAGPEKEISVSWTCHLIALFMSIKSPWSPIKSIQLNSNETCTLSDSIENSCTTKKLIYEKFEGQWCQVIGNEVQPLKELL